MLVSGDWVTPRLNDLRYLEKPPLQYWATAAMYSVFGVSEWTSRAFAFSLAFLCLPLVYAFARSLHGSADTGVAAALALAINPGFAVIGRINLLDSAFTFFLSLSLFAFLLAMQSDERSVREHRLMLAMWASLALAVLTKGIAGPVLCGATLLVYSAWTRQWSLWRRMHWLSGLALLAAIAMPWFVAVSMHNPGFLQYFFVHEHFQRFSTDVSHRAGPWWYFLPLVIAAVVPWVAILWRQRNLGAQASPGESVRVGTFLLTWATVVTLFFSISQSKLLPYVLPVMPALAVFLAPRIARDPRSTAAATWWTVGTLTCMGAALLVYARRDRAIIPMDVELPVAMATIAVLWVILKKLISRRPQDMARSGWHIAAVALFGWSMIAIGYGIVDPHSSARNLVEDMRSQVPAQAPLFSVGQYRQTIAPYLGRTMRLVNFRGELDFGLSLETHDPELSIDEFKRQWESLEDGVAIIAVGKYANLAPGLAPFVVVARDRNSVVIRRQ